MSKHEYDHPESYTKVVNAQFEKPVEPTYEVAHQLIGKLDYDLDTFCKTTDWYNLPSEVYYESSLKKYPGADESIKKGLEIDLRIWKSDFSDYIHSYMSDECGFDMYNATLQYFPTKAVTKSHIDFHGGFRNRHGLYDILTPPKMYDVIKRHWVPLTDRKYGHYFEMNGHILDWKAGDIFWLRTQYPHVGACLASDPRIFLILTGAKQEDIDAATK